MAQAGIDRPTPAELTLRPNADLAVLCFLPWLARVAVGKFQRVWLKCEKWCEKWCLECLDLKTLDPQDGNGNFQHFCCQSRRIDSKIFLLASSAFLFAKHEDYKERKRKKTAGVPIFPFCR